jgi:hypothetical protein
MQASYMTTYSDSCPAQRHINKVFLFITGHKGLKYGTDVKKIYCLMVGVLSAA